ncbi:hypothetical protein COCOBI_03-2520 [Coccomyxa sp. Obi]|nr:hypothetical protein COCOBI_03-2520 [Coccomyxa sp. Obi]
MRDDSANTLDPNHLSSPKHKTAVKSSLKGSKSQLSLEEVARAARKNASRRNARVKAKSTLSDLLQQWEQARKGEATTAEEPSTGSSSDSVGAEPQAVVLACADCDVPLPEAFGSGANDIALLRAQGNIATPGVAAQIAQTMEDTGARLVIVLGHTECAAVDRAIDRWLDKTAWTWPWLSQTTSLHHPPNWQPLQSLGPPKPPSASTDSSSRTPEEATRSDKLNLTGIKEGSFLKSLVTCYCGAGMEEDESNHPSTRSCAPSPDGSVRGGGPAARGGASAAMSMSDRTVVHTLGDTLEVAVDEVALQRLKAAEEAGRSRDHPKDIPPDTLRNPIEAPRARRSISLHNTSHGMRSAEDELSEQGKRRSVIIRNAATASDVAAANAKLAAEALLRGLSKRLDAEALREVEVVAMSCDVDTRELTMLRKGWYHHCTYFFE